MSRIDRITRAINRHAWALWMLLIGSLGLSASVGMDPIGPPAAHGDIGHGMVVGDWAAAVLCAWASVTLIVVRGTSTRRIGLVAAGDWLQLLALTAAGVRVTWMLAMYGDATLSPTALVALILFALSSLDYSLGRLMRVGAQDC